MEKKPAHVVAVFGGAVSGAEAADFLSSKGVKVVVFDQNILPFGKIEDGLPMWHVKLRDKEEEKIIEKLSHENVTFVPSTKLGADIQFDELVNDWEFSAVLLATGAWKDRPLPIDGIEEYVGKGLYYQNPFFRWFNHAHDESFEGDACEILDDALVVGGGLASIDVAKALMIETVRKALSEHGHEIDLLTIEKKEPKHVLDELGLTLADLGLKGCTLAYRRKAIYMPITPIPEDADERRIAKAQEVRQRMVDNLQENYLFKFVECKTPVDKIVENDRLAGIKFERTKIVDGRVVHTNEFSEFRSPLVISSIGSIPEPIPGMPIDGTTFKVVSEESGQLEGYEHVFLLGNAVTGKGNIKASRKHGLGVAEVVAERLESQEVLSETQVASILDRVEARQKEAGYDGNLVAWAEKYSPSRLENMI